MVAMRDSSKAALAVGRFAGWEPLGFEAGDENWYRFVANGPTERTDSSGLNSCDDKAQLTPDQQRLHSSCFTMTVPPKKCGDCSFDSYQIYIRNFQIAVKATWVANVCGLYIGWNTCERWALDLEGRLPNFGVGSDCIQFAGVVAFDIGGFLSPSHAVYKLEMCDGTVVYADNGAWGGGDHIFYAEDIPPTEKPI
jgi:hypothetical protein